MQSSDVFFFILNLQNFLVRLSMFVLSGAWQFVQPLGECGENERVHPHTRVHLVMKGNTL